jgi:hypothetical protein
VPATDLGPAGAGSRTLLVEMLKAQSDTTSEADCYRGALTIIPCAFVTVHGESMLLIVLDTLRSSAAQSSSIRDPFLVRDKACG